LVAGTISFASGLWTVFKNPRAQTNRLFGLLCLSLCFWLFGIFMVYSSPQETEALFWEKFIYIGVVFIPAVFSQFCTNFLQSTRDNKITLLNYLISTLFVLLIFTTYLINCHNKLFLVYFLLLHIIILLLLNYLCISKLF